MEQRRAFRYLADMDVGCRVPASPKSVTIKEISIEGCRISVGDGSIVPGGTILLELLPGFHAIGMVIWHRDNEAGIKFDKSLHPSLIDHVRNHDT